MDTSDFAALFTPITWFFFFPLINAAFRGLAGCAVCASESGISAAVNNPTHSEDVRRSCFKANLTVRAKIDNLCCCSCVLTQLISAKPKTIH